VDIDGFGDSPARAERVETSVVSVLGIDDVLDVARAVSPDDPANVVLIGHSSSGYLILEAALSLAPRGVCSVNPWLVFQPPEMAAGAAMDERRRFCLSRSGLATALVTRARDQTRLQRLDQRFPNLATRIRMPVRKAAWLLRSVAAPQMNRPGERVGDLVNAGTDLLLICGAEDIQPFTETGLGAVRRAESQGRLQVEEIPTLEHSLLSARERDEVAELIVGRLLSRFGPAPTT
jgi:pimeloyl-ACP methyl ester carboxylesterase